MLEDKIHKVFEDMVVLKDPGGSEYFSKLSIPSYMRDWLAMKFSDEDGTIDYDSVRRYINRYIPSREDYGNVSHCYNCKKMWKIIEWWEGNYG